MANKPLNIISLNVRGLRNNKKRANIFHWLKTRKYDIFFLQETHCHLRKEAIKWGKEWSLSLKNSYWSRGTNRRKGVTVLFGKNYICDNVSIKDQMIDSNGRTIKMILDIGQQNYRLINLYAPNEECERVKFLVDLGNLLKDAQEVLVIDALSN